MFRDSLAAVVGACNALLLRADDLLSAHNDKIELGNLRCSQGHLALSRHDDAHVFARAAEALASEVRAGPESELGRGIARLNRAIKVAALDSPELLLRGEVVAELPASIIAKLGDELKKCGEAV